MRGIEGIWFSRGGKDTCGSNLWKAIRAYEVDFFLRTSFDIGNGLMVKFWQHPYCNRDPLIVFLGLFNLVVHKEAWVANYEMVVYSIFGGFLVVAIGLFFISGKLEDKLVWKIAKDSYIRPHYLLGDVSTFSTKPILNLRVNSKFIMFYFLLKVEWENSDYWSTYAERLEYC